MVRFIDALFERLPVLQSTARQPSEMEGDEPVRDGAGLKRFPPMQQKIEAAQAAAASQPPAVLMPAHRRPIARRRRHGAPGLAQDVQRSKGAGTAVQDFMEWAKTRR